MKSNQPGRSNRTPFKHSLLDAIVGKVAGSLSTGRTCCRRGPFYCADLCGGDGEETADHKASPLILHRHCSWLRGKGWAPELDVIEIHDQTYERLHANTSGLPGFGEWLRVNRGDSREFTLPSVAVDQAAFIHCDPNTVDQMPVTGALVESFSRYTMFLVTLGCNVSGLKRLPIDRRRVWFDYVDVLVRVLPSHHDAILFWLNRDQSQWAYLLSLPRKWSDDFRGVVQRRAAAGWAYGISAAGYRGERAEFDQAIRRLFLTEAEYGRAS